MFKVFENSRYSDGSYFFKIHKYLMRFLGYWPGDPPSACRVFICFLGVLYSLFFCAFELNFAYHNSKDLAIMLDSLTGITPKVVTIIKLMMIMYYRKEVSEMLHTLKKYFEDGNYFYSLHRLILRTYYNYSVKNKNKFLFQTWMKLR